MKYSFIYILFFLLSWADLSGQEALQGEVSYVTSTNVYVRYTTTSGIEVGDSLFLDASMSSAACLIVKQKSSTSCVCDKIEKCEVTVGMQVWHKSVVKDDDETVDFVNPANVEIKDSVTNEVFDQLPDISLTEDITDEKSGREQKISGRISASSYSQFQPNSDNRHRVMTRMSLNAKNISGSKLSFESYVNYRKNFEDSQGPLDRNSFLRVYNAALIYEIDSSSSIVVGRRINRKMSSIGAVDGIQYDKSFKSFYAGVIVGFRPDLVEFDFNSQLLEYGVYVGKDMRMNKAYGQTTFGVLEQKNGSAIDRRYAYLQHSLSLNRKTHFYASAELDLYQNINGDSKMEPRLTNFYVSCRHKFSRWLTLSVSYDSRKRIIFYESLRTEVEELLADDQSRQGVRTRINIRPVKYVILGASYSKRFQSNNQNASDNYNGFISYSKVPGIGGSLNLNTNVNKSIYLTSNIISVRYSKSLIRKKLNMDLYYRNVSYKYIGNETSRKQQFYGANLSFRLSKQLSFNILGELSSYSEYDSKRINTKLIKRF